MAKESSSPTSSTSSSSGYALGPPWLFRGSALYQLHLVKSEIARSFLPKELKLVEAFGYTLGGLFLAHYDDSPAGVFDELVVIAGIVWNPPTSCAWAARVLVNSREACIHGRKEIGLPSNVAVFSKREVKTAERPPDKRRDFLNMVGLGSMFPNRKEYSDIHISETTSSSEMSICSIRLPFVGDSWKGPMIRMSLPSFSGWTIHNPHLLRYSCQIESSVSAKYRNRDGIFRLRTNFKNLVSSIRVRLVEAAKISRTNILAKAAYSDDQKAKDGNADVEVTTEDEACSRSISVLLSKPILALKFSSLRMQVERPTIINPRPSPKRTQVGDFRTC